MNWLFSKSSSPSHIPIASTTPLQQQRLKQIKSLQHYNPNVIEVERDTEYEVTFQCCATNVTLTVKLPTNFPNERPFVTVTPYFKHAWVNDQMLVIGSPGLNMFYMHSDLGKVIQHIIKEFKKNPPQFEPSVFPLPPVPPGFATTVYSPSSQVVGNLINTSTASDRPPPYATTHNITTSPQASSFEEMSQREIEVIMDKLDQLQKEELSNIFNNEDMLLEYVKEMESISGLQVQRVKLIEENAEIAKRNMAIEPDVEDLKLSLKELNEECSDLYHKFQGKSQQQEELSQIYDMNQICMNLRISVLQAEEDSEKIADQFLNGELNLDGFLSTFMDQRKLCHLRRAKEECLKSIIVE